MGRTTTTRRNNKRGKFRYLTRSCLIQSAPSRALSGLETAIFSAADSSSPSKLLTTRFHRSTNAFLETNDVSSKWRALPETAGAGVVAATPRWARAACNGSRVSLRASITLRASPQAGGTRMAVTAWAATRSIRADRPHACGDDPSSRQLTRLGSGSTATSAWRALQTGLEAPAP